MTRTGHQGEIPDGDQGAAMAMQAVAGALLAGRYRLVSQLGKGGMGTVWQAHDQVLDRMVAVKFVNSQGHGRPGAESRLHREAKVLGSISHPHLAHVHDLCETDEGTFIVMELIHGESLAALLLREPCLPPGQAAEIAAQCTRALGAAHRAGIVHRDVKPSNIMITDGNAKLIDFGIAGSLNPVDTTMVGVMGTVAYLAPERVTGSSATPATDMYALGVVLYEMLTGQLPFHAEESIAVLYAHATLAPSPLPATIPAELAETCLSLLAKDPADRPDSGTVAHDLALSATSSSPSTTDHIHATSHPDSTSHPWVPLDIAPKLAFSKPTFFGHRSLSSTTNLKSRRHRGVLLPAGALLSATVVACATWLITTTGTSSAAAQPRPTPATTAHTSPAETTAPATTPPAAAIPKTNATTRAPTVPAAVAVQPPAAPKPVKAPPGNSGPGTGPGKGNSGPGPGPGKGNPHAGK